MNPTVSIIIPTYKRAAFLERAIESVLNQTYEDVQVVIVDDNNKDSNYRTETEKIMEKYVSNEKVVYIQNEENKGGALSRNNGIEIASGEFISFLDDDDIYLKEKVEIQLKYMLEKGLDFSFTDVRIHNQNNVLIDYREHSYVKTLSKNELLRMHIMHHLTPTATFMLKKHSLQSIGGFDDVKMGQEFMLMLKAIEQDLKIGYIPKAQVIQYLHNEERISIGPNKLNKEIELYNFKKKYFKYLSEKEISYVKFRHHAVMAIVGKRSFDYKVAISHSCKAIFTSPISCIQMLNKHFSKVKRHKI